MKTHKTDDSIPLGSLQMEGYSCDWGETGVKEKEKHQKSNAKFGLKHVGVSLMPVDIQFLFHLVSVIYFDVGVFLILVDIFCVFNIILQDELYDYV